MEFESVNIIIRKSIKKIFDREFCNGKTKVEIANMIRDQLYSMEPLEIEEFNSKKENERVDLIKLMYLDALKMTIYKHKSLLVDEDEMYFFNNLTSIESEEELLAEISSDPDLFSKIILECYNFVQMNDFSKIVLFKSMSNDENSFLSRTYKLHLYDAIVYNKKIEIADVITYLKKYVKEQEKLFGEVLDDNLVEIFAGFVSSIIRFDGSNSIDFVLDLGKIDYSVCKYISKNIEPSDYILDHIDFYENYSTRDILYRLTVDQVFLKDALWMFYALYIDRGYEDISLDETILETEDSKKIKNKLIIK